MKIMALALALVCSPAHATGFGGELTTEATAADVGVAVYPGAQRLKTKHDDNAVRLGFWTPEGGFRLAVVKYKSDDEPAKVRAFYLKELSRFGPVSECTGGGDDDECSDKDNDEDDGALKLRAGPKSDRRIVAISPRAHGGSKLVLVRLQLKSG